MSMQSLRTPWADYDPRCESWEEGGFHPLAVDNALFGKKSFDLAELRESLNMYRIAESDTLLSVKYRAESVTRRKRVESWIAQLTGVPGSIPEAAGDEYRSYVDSVRKNLV